MGGSPRIHPERSYHAYSIVETADYHIANVQHLSNLLDNFRLSLPCMATTEDADLGGIQQGSQERFRDGGWWAEYGRTFLLLQRAHALARDVQPLLDANSLLCGLGYEVHVLLGNLLRVLPRRNRDNDRKWTDRWEKLEELAERMRPVPALLGWSMHEPAPDQGGGERSEPLVVDKKKNTARVRGVYEEFDLTEAQTRILMALLDAKGAWVPGKNLRFQRPDRAIQKLPPTIKDLVESKRGTGYRIRQFSEQRTEA